MYSFRHWVRDVIARNTLCRVGRHSKATGQGLDACARGCGFIRNLGALKKYEVVLMTGERFEVAAINEFHAGSVVVYGTAQGKMDQYGHSLNPVKVHRNNIKTVRLLN